MAEESEIEIEDGIELPPPERTTMKYPLSKLKEGQSFMVGAADRKRARSLRNTMNQAARRLEVPIAVRSVYDKGGALTGIRVWRISARHKGTRK